MDVSGIIARNRKREIVAGLIVKIRRWTPANGQFAKLSGLSIDEAITTGVFSNPNDSYPKFP